ncbi:AzlC family ABC transporter permease [Leifsonia aquatica]|uniref:AzlC protein n=2 Tax=Leifsonia aquatica TaxID=144185 RepID=U2RSQ9_LEIAQ|nr:AzlC family ABC transporter permease [Leifsonia aquatica]ERK71856.1 AzlC protein [Leifsonia aquatica ATCC 14665]MBB2967483.1 putative branched-subunit amino acid permease [Leifsonia aquatica]
MADDRSPEVRAAARSGWAVGLATAAYGISFGALATASGLDVWQACVLSLLMFSGGSQFALIGVLASGGTAAGGTAIASAALLGVRNSFYALRLSRIIDRGLWRRTAAVQLTIDESTAVATAQTDPRAQRVGFWVTGLVVYIGWNLTTLAGALLGNLIGDVRAYGLDAAAAAAFLGLLWPRLKARQTQAVAVAAGFVATLLTPFILPGLPVLAAAAVAIIVGVLNLFGRRDDPPHPEAIPMEREVEP